jgi:hypothetical protein
MGRNFTLSPNADSSRYLLKREGDPGSMEFVSFRTALEYARLCPESTESTVVLFDAWGTETMRFPARLPQRSLQRA